MSLSLSLEYKCTLKGAGEGVKRKVEYNFEQYVLSPNKNLSIISSITGGGVLSGAHTERLRQRQRQL